MRGNTVVTTLLLLLPQVSLAAVSISEIAWMGSVESANDEWIELHNNGEAPINLAGWELIDNDSLSITLAGTVGAGQFAVLERTNDDSAPGSAFLIYTGALKNTGATLTLKNNVGATVDVVEGGKDWQKVGGDNRTKATAQKTETGWITAPATPGEVTAVQHKTETRGETGQNSIEGTTMRADDESVNSSQASTTTSSPAQAAAVIESVPRLKDNVLPLIIIGLLSATTLIIYGGGRVFEHFGQHN